MKSKHDIIVSTGAIVLIGAFISFLLLIRIEHVWQALLIGYFYSIILVGSLSFIRKYVVRKLTVLPIVQQWFFRSIIYTITISFAYLLGLLFQTLVLTPLDQLQQVVLNKIWQTLVELVSSPFNLEFSRIFPELQQPIIIVFFAVLVFIGVISLLGSYVEIKWRENRNKQLRDRAELHTLKSQIEPHFLFNTLNTITSLIKQDPNKAEEMIIQLSEILQYRSIYAKKDCVPLKDEISFTKKYVKLLEARFEKTLNVSWHENFQESDFKVPVLIFQPLIENCVRHAWQDKNKMLELNITINLHKGSAQILVADNGKGIPAQMLNKLPISNHALANIAERLQVMFRKNNLLSIDSIPGEGTTVTINIPESCYDQSDNS